MSRKRTHAPHALSVDDVAYARSLLIHEDAQVLVFDKPAGLPVQGGSGVTRSLEDLLAAFAKSNGKRPRLVHRLDREAVAAHFAAQGVNDLHFISAQGGDGTGALLAAAKTRLMELEALEQQTIAGDASPSAAGQADEPVHPPASASNISDDPSSPILPA